jgi:two-component system, chemotaxis family, CheB/CheR fusion protein
LDAIPNPPPGPPLRVLVVEDDPDTSRAAATLLGHAGFRPLVAGDGPTALELAAREGFDAALLDIGLPGMDGYEVARRLRELPREPRPLLVAVTGLPSEADGRRSVAAGIDLHLVKPADTNFLVSLLRRHAELTHPPGDRP